MIRCMHMRQIVIAVAALYTGTVVSYGQITIENKLDRVVWIGFVKDWQDGAALASVNPSGGTWTGNFDQSKGTNGRIIISFEEKPDVFRKYDSQRKYNIALAEGDQSENDPTPVGKTYKRNDVFGIWHKDRFDDAVSFQEGGLTFMHGTKYVLAGGPNILLQAANPNMGDTNKVIDFRQITLYSKKEFETLKKVAETAPLARIP